MSGTIREPQGSRRGPVVEAVRPVPPVVMRAVMGSEQRRAGANQGGLDGVERRSPGSAVDPTALLLGVVRGEREPRGGSPPGADFRYDVRRDVRVPVGGLAASRPGPAASVTAGAATAGVAGTLERASGGGPSLGGGELVATTSPSRGMIPFLGGMQADVVGDALRLVDRYVADVSDALRERRIGVALRLTGELVFRLAERVVGAVFDGAMLAVGAIAERMPAGPGGVTPRPLSPDERALLERSYGSALDLDRVRVGSARVMTVGMRSGGRVVGDTVYLTRDHFDADGRLRPESVDLFCHEVAHVYQYQRGGADYMHRAVFPRVRLDDAAMYDWQGPLRSRPSPGALTPEQQAELIGGVTWFLHRHPGRPADRPFVAGDIFATRDHGPSLMLDEPMAQWLNALQAQVRAGVDPRWMTGVG